MQNRQALVRDNLLEGMATNSELMMTATHSAAEPRVYTAELESKLQLIVRLFLAVVLTPVILLAFEVFSLVAIYCESRQRRLRRIRQPQ